MSVSLCELPKAGLAFIHSAQDPESYKQMLVHICTHVLTLAYALGAELTLASMPLLAFEQMSGGNGSTCSGFSFPDLIPYRWGPYQGYLSLTTTFPPGRPGR